MRLIDANAADVERICCYYGDNCRIEDVQEWLDEQPTIDAAPVVHARWLTSSDDPDRLICSACGRRFDMYRFDQKDMPFCLCGAKMDGGNC